MPNDTESQTEIDSLRQMYKQQKYKVEVAKAYLTNVLEDTSMTPGEQMIAQMALTYLQEN